MKTGYSLDMSRDFDREALKEIRDEMDKRQQLIEKEARTYAISGGHLPLEEDAKLYGAFINATA